MESHLTDPAAASEWMKAERKRRGWSTITLADVARAIAEREGSSMKLRQQSISDFEQEGRAKRMPEWMRYVRMAFEEGEPSAKQETAPRDELAYVREVDIRYAMGDGSAIEEYPSASLVPFNFGFLRGITRAPLERLFLATGHGDSMEPTLLRNDLILIDTNETRVTQGDLIWALEYAGSGLIKRLRRVRRDGVDLIRILSDNPAVPSEDALPADVHVVGKVVWIGRRM